MQIRETEDSLSRSQEDKRVRRGEIGPGEREGPEAPGGRVMEKGPGFSPGRSLGNEGKLLTGERMERMGDREDQLTIRVIGCS